MSKRPHDVENKENEFSVSFIDQNASKKVKILEEEIIQQQTEFSDSDEGEGDDEPWPIESIIQYNDGTIHPIYKQYIVYENIEPYMISKTARFWSRKYLKIFRHVDPDTYNMYIHNDFVCYGEFEIIENCIIDIAKGIFMKYKKQMNFSNYIFAFRRLEALTTILNCSHNFVGIDDGERFVEFIRVVGACYVTILRGLLPKAMFNDDELNDDDTNKLKKVSKQLPNFQQVIKQSLILGHNILSIGDIRSAYINILQTVYCKWSILIDRISSDFDVKPNKIDEPLWEALRHASKIKKTAYKESFNFMKEFDTYSKNNPDLGGDLHDLRKWSKTKRTLYSIDHIDDESDESFWFRL